MLASRLVALSLMCISCSDCHGQTEWPAALWAMKRRDCGKLPSPKLLGAYVEPPDAYEEYRGERDEDWNHGLCSQNSRRDA